MTFLNLARFLKSPWSFAIIAVAVLALLAVALASNRSVADEPPPTAGPETQVRPPVSTPDMVNYTNVEDLDEVVDLGPPTVEIIQEPVGGGGMTDARAEYLTAEPGRAIYLHSADQVIHLPPDVKVEKTITFGYCADPRRCPTHPARILAKGDATILIDDEGVVFPNNQTELKAFPFLAGQKVK